MLGTVHMYSGHGETQQDTLKPEDLDHVYDYKSDDDNDIIWQERKQKLGPQNTEDGRRYLTYNRTSILFLESRKCQELLS